MAYNGAGIYGLYNVMEHKIYIGKSVHIANRISEHKYNLKLGAFGCGENIRKAIFDATGAEFYHINLMCEPTRKRILRKISEKVKGGKG